MAITLSLPLKSGKELVRLTRHHSCHILIEAILVRLAVLPKEMIPQQTRAGIRASTFIGSPANFFILAFLANFR